MTTAEARARISEEFMNGGHSMKDYSWSMTVQREDGTVEYRNETDTANGCRKSWYMTEDAARKGLNTCLALNVRFGYKVLSWMLFHRNHGIGVIDSYTAN